MATGGVMKIRIECEEDGRKKMSDILYVALIVYSMAMLVFGGLGG